MKHLERRGSIQTIKPATIRQPYDMPSFRKINYRLGIERQKRQKEASRIMERMYERVMGR